MQLTKFSCPDQTKGSHERYLRCQNNLCKLGSGKQKKLNPFLQKSCFLLGLPTSAGTQTECQNLVNAGLNATVVALTLPSLQIAIRGMTTTSASPKPSTTRRSDGRIKVRNFTKISLDAVFLCAIFLRDYSSM